MRLFHGTTKVAAGRIFAVGFRDSTDYYFFAVKRNRRLVVECSATRAPYWQFSRGPGAWLHRPMRGASTGRMMRNAARIGSAGAKIASSARLLSLEMGYTLIAL